MKPILYYKSLLTILFIFSIQNGIAQRYWISGIAGNWSGDNWSSTTGGLPDGLGPPSAGVNAIFDAAGAGNCTVDIAANFDGINTTGYTGIIDLNGQTFNVFGTNNSVFSSGTINDTPGTSSINFAGTGVSTFSGTTFGSSLTGTMGGLLFNGSIFNSIVNLNKTGSANNNSTGGNTFNADLTLENSGSGQLLLCNTLADNYNGNVVLNQTGTYRFYLGNSAPGINITGDLTINMTSTGAGSYFYVASAAASSLSVAGNVIVNVSGSSANEIVYFGNSGDVTVGGDLDIDNSGLGNSSQIIVANGVDSEVNVAGTFNAANNATSATSAYIYIGNSGDVNCDGELNIVNNCGSTNSSIFVGSTPNSDITFDADITVRVTNVNSDGIYFGINGATGTLAAGATISIPGVDPLNYIGGSLRFRNFTYLGNTAVSFELGSTAQFFQSYDSDWGGDVTFKAPRFLTNGSTFRGVSLLEKTGGLSNDASIGGNTFMGNLTLNNSGSLYFLMGNGNPDIFQGDVIMNNTGSNNLYIAYNSFGNTITGDLYVNNIGGNPSGSTNSFISNTAVASIDIAGDVEIVNNATSSSTDYVYLGNGGDVTIAGSVDIANSCGTNSQIRIANGTNSYVDITGNLTIDNIATGGTGQYVYAPYDGDMDLLGNLDIQNNSTATNGIITIADRTTSSVTLNGTSTVLNNSTGTTNRIFLGHNGSVTFNNTLDITNAGSATNSQIYLNHGIASNNIYNDDITVKSTNLLSDGIYFGNGGGSGTLIATKSIAIPGVDVVNFIGGSLYFRNFTQTGATNHSFELASTASFIYNYDCDWGGNVDFKSPRVYTRGTMYRGTSSIIKTGGVSNDNCVGGNTFTGDAHLENNGSLYFLMGNGNPDVFLANANLVNSGSSHLYLAYAGPGHSVAGNLTISNSAIGAAYNNIYITSTATSELSIAGDVSVTHDGSGTTLYTYLGNSNLTNILGDVTLNNAGTGNRSDIYVSNNSNAIVNISGNTTLTSSISAATIKLNYIGNQGILNMAGNFDINHLSNSTNSQVYVANYASSIVTINGNTNVINGPGGSTTKRITLGNSGSTIFNGTLNLENHSSAANSHMFLNYSTNSNNSYNEDILVSSLDAAGDGISFGQNNGSGTLAAGKLISIPGVDVTNFIGGSLYFRNFTQVGPTDHSFELGPTALYIQNRNSNWGGNVDFRAPRMYTNSTTYNGTAYLEKTGGVGNDGSPAGNVFIGDATLVNSGSLYFMLGNGGTFDDFQGNVSMTNTGSHSMYLAYNSLGNQIAGNLVTTQSSVGGTSSAINICTVTNSSLSVGGDVSLTIDGSSTNQYTHFGSAGDVTVLGNVTTINAGTGVTSDVRISNSSSSSASIAGFVHSTNSPTLITTQTTYIGNSGDLSIGGDLDLINNTTATTGNMYLGNGTNSTITVDGSTTISNAGSGTSRYVYLGNNGQITFNGTLDITNSSNATNSVVYCNNGINGVNLYNDDITVKSLDVDVDGIYFGSGGGSGTLAATKTITIPGVDPANFIGGRLAFRNFTQVGPTDHAFELGPTASYIYNYDSDWGGNVDFKSPRVYLRTTVFNQNAYIEKTGAGNDYLPGGCSYLGNAEFNLSNVINTGYLYLAASFPSNVTNDLTLRNTGSYGTLHFGNASGAYTVGGDLFMEQTTSGTESQHTYYGNNATSTFTIGGNVDLINNASNTAGSQYMFLINNGTATIGGNVTSSNIGVAGNNKSVYIGNSGSIDIAGTLDISQSTSANSANTYIAQAASSLVSIDGAATINQSTSGTTNSYVYVGNYGDVVFNSTLDMVNSSDATNSPFYLNYRAGSDNLYNDDVTVSSLNVNSDGFHFGTANGTGILAAGKTITIPGVDIINFIGGDLRFRNFTQTGPTPHSFELASTASYILNYNSNWGGNVDFRAPRMNTRETTYQGTSYLLKTGSSDDLSYGNNIFTGIAELENTGPNYFGMGATNPDICLSDLTLTNSGSGRIFYAWNSAGNQVAGDLIVDNFGNGTNSHIYVGYSGAAVTINVDGDLIATNNGTATTNNTLIIGNNGTFDIGGNLTASNIGTGTAGNLYVGNVADVNIAGASTFLNSATQSGQIYVAENTNSEVVFGGDVSVTNTGGVNTKRCYFGDYGDVTYNGNLEIINSTGATNSQMYFNYRPSAVSLYNENITLENTNATGDGIYFGTANGNGTLAAGKTVSLSAGGFIAGQLYFRNFNQLGATPQAITTTGTSRLTNYNSIWNGNVDFRSPRHYTNYTNYNADAHLEKTGADSDASTGGNTYNGTTSIVNSGTGYFMPANGTSDDFNGDVSFITNNTGVIRPNYNCINTYAGDINIDNPSVQLYFGAAGNGRTLLDGASDQDINDLGTSNLPLFRDFHVNKTGGAVNVNMPIEITIELDLDQGIVNTTAASLLTMRDNATVSSVSNASHIDGPIEKIGNDAFTFPVGNQGFYRPISMSNPSSGASRFRGQYFLSDPHNSGYLDGARAAGVGYISDCEFWTLDRTNGTNNVIVTLSYDTQASPCSGINDPTSVEIARWDGAQWQDHGNGAMTGTPTVGTISTSGVVTSFSPFTFHTSDEDNNPLPITLIDFTAKVNITSTVDLNWTTASEINNEFFTIERSSDGIDFVEILTQSGAGNSNTELTYFDVDKSPLNGTSYYRLKQIDFDGQFTYSEIQKIELSNDNEISIYPNPIDVSHGITTLNVQISSDQSTFEIVDQLGSVVISSNQLKEGENSINVSNLSSGIYFVRVHNLQSIQNLRFIVQ